MKNTSIVSPGQLEPGDRMPWRIVYDPDMPPELLALLTFARALPPGFKLRMPFFEFIWGWKKYKRQKIARAGVDLGYLKLVKGGEEGGSYYLLTEKAQVRLINTQEEYEYAQQAFIRMYESAREKARAGKSSSREIEPESGGESLKNRQSKKPTVEKSGSIDNKEIIKQQNKNIQQPPTAKEQVETLHINTHIGGSSIDYKNVDLSFLDTSDMNFYQDEIRNQLVANATAGTALEAWMRIVPESNDLDSGAVKWALSTYGYIRFIAASVLVKTKCKKIGSRLKFFEKVLDAFGGADHAAPAEKKAGKNMPGWFKPDATFNLSQYDILTRNHGFAQDQFQKIGEDAYHDDVFYTLKDGSRTRHNATDSPAAGSPAGGKGNIYPAAGPTTASYSGNDQGVRKGLHRNERASTTL